MDHREFFKKLNNGFVARCYLFTGSEAYTKQQALKQLREQILPAGLEALNENVLEGQSADDIIAACETLPMMADRRLVLVRDYAPLLTGRAAGDKDDAEQLAKYLPTLPETVCLLFYMRDSADERKSLFKSISGAQGAFVVRFDELNDADLRTWVNRELGRYGKSITAENLDSFLFRTGRSLTHVATEVSKLVGNSGERAEIAAEDLEIVTPSLEFTIFDLINRVVARDAEGTYKMLRKTLERGENRVGVLAMITRQMRFMAQIGYLQSRRASDDEIMKTLEITRTGLYKTRQQLHGFTQAKVTSAYKQCVEADYAIKSGQISDTEALDRLLLGWLSQDK